MSRDDGDIIEIEDFHVVEDEISPIADEDEEPPPPYQSELWRREVRTTGPGCCFGLSLTLLLLAGILLLGLCVVCWLTYQALF